MFNQPLLSFWSTVVFHTRSKAFDLSVFLYFKLNFYFVCNAGFVDNNEALLNR